MSTNQGITKGRRRHLKTRRRRLKTMLAVASASGAGALAMLGGSASIALADAPIVQSFTSAGTYTVTVPSNATYLSIDAVGGAGQAGGENAIYAALGGTGGSGTEVKESLLPVGSGDLVAPGDVLQVVVGAYGGGGAGGGPDVGGGFGGSGGGATVVTDPTSGALAIAGGGGGGGGGGTLFTGGNGGTDGDGQATNFTGSIAARGGVIGTNNCPASGSELTGGDSGENDTTDAGGGGGGGGGGWCGGQGGGSGDHGAGKYAGGVGGGGGGAGGSMWAGQYGGATAATNSGAGSVTLQFNLGAPPTAVLGASSLAFGDQEVGTSGQPQTVSLTNNGDLPLTLYGLGTSGADASDFSTNLGTCDQTLDAGASCTLSVTFSPTGAGQRTATVELSDSASASPQEITLTGTGQAPATATLSATSIDFGDQEIGTKSAIQYVTLTNNGDLPLTFHEVHTTNYPPFAGALGTCVLILPPHSSCQLGGTFAPVADGTVSGEFELFDSAPDSPQIINVTGTGGTIAASLSATSIDYGSENVGSRTQSQYVTLTDTGDLPLKFYGLGSSGSQQGDFRGDLGSCTEGLYPQQSCQLGASFAPTTTGNRSATLLVEDNAPGGPQQITLTGTGTQPTVAPPPGGGQGTGSNPPPESNPSPGSNSASGSDPTSGSNLAATIVGGTTLGGTTSTTSTQGTHPQVMCVVPHLHGLTLSAARRALAHAHCGVGAITTAPNSSGHRVLRVMRQAASAGTRRRAGYRVSLHVGAAG